MKSLARRVLAGFAPLLLAQPALARTPEPVEVARPALWEVSDADTKIYLFGTIHLLPQNVKWQSRALDAAIAGSDELVVETIVDEKNPGPMLKAMSKLGLSPNLPPVLDRVGADKRPLLEAAIGKLGIPAQSLDKMETWAVAFMLMGQQFKAADLDTSQGVEIILRQGFEGRQKKVGELESNEEQLSYFDRLSEGSQRQFLESVLESNGDFKEQFSGMVRSWTRGDTEAIARTFNAEMNSLPELQRGLITERNGNWVRWIGERMDAPGTVLLAVGAGHLAGPDSVIALLQREGMKVRRLQ